MKQYFINSFSIIRKYFLLVKTQAYTYKKTSLVVALLCLWAGYHFYSTAEIASVTYQYGAVKRGVLTSTVSASGQVTPNSQVDLKPKVNANVVGVNVRAGDRVKTGQTLFRLDATDAYKQVRDAKLSLDSANLALEKLRNPKTIDVMSITDAIKKEEQTKKDQDTKVATAYRNLLNSGIQAVPSVSYTTETAPIISGSYSQSTEGQIKISVYQGGTTGYTFSLSGLSSSTGDISTTVAQPLGDTGLYSKWVGSNPQTNWIINIPNKEASNYLSNYNAYQNALSDRDSANAASDRTIATLQQKLSDLTPQDDNLDVKSAILSVKQRENALTDAQQTLSNYTLTAPFDGVMASVSVDIGSSAVMASSNSSAALGTIVTDKKLAQITLNETDIVKVHLGQKAVVTFDAVEGLSVDGTVVEINTLGTVTSGVVTYKVKVAFNADDLRILPNMSVSVDVITDSKDGVLFVPNQALKHDADGYYVEENPLTPVPVNASSTRKFTNASSTGGYRIASSTASSSDFRNRNASSSRRRNAGSSSADSTTSSSVSVVLKRVPVTIGLQTDTQTEITSGLVEGQQIVIKKVTGTTASAAKAAPSITSLLRPQGQARTGSATSGTRAR